MTTFRRQLLLVDGGVGSFESNPHKYHQVSMLIIRFNLLGNVLPVFLIVIFSTATAQNTEVSG